MVRKTKYAKMMDCATADDHSMSPHWFRDTRDHTQSVPAGNSTVARHVGSESGIAVIHWETQKRGMMIVSAMINEVKEA